VRHTNEPAFNMIYYVFFIIEIIDLRLYSLCVDSVPIMTNSVQVFCSGLLMSWVFIFFKL